MTLEDLALELHTQINLSDSVGLSRIQEFTSQLIIEDDGFLSNILQILTTFSHNYLESGNLSVSKSLQLKKNSAKVFIVLLKIPEQLQKS